MFDYIEVLYIVTQNHQEHVLIVTKLKNTTYIRADTNYAQCIDSVQVNGIIYVITLSLV